MRKDSQMPHGNGMYRLPQQRPWRAASNFLNRRLESLSVDETDDDPIVPQDHFMCFPAEIRQRIFLLCLGPPFPSASDLCRSEGQTERAIGMLWLYDKEDRPSIQALAIDKYAEQYYPFYSNETDDPSESRHIAYRLIRVCKTFAMDVKIVLPIFKACLDQYRRATQVKKGLMLRLWREYFNVLRNIYPDYSTRDYGDTRRARTYWETTSPDELKIPVDPRSYGGSLVLSGGRASDDAAWIETELKEFEKLGVSFVESLEYQVEARLRTLTRSSNLGDSTLKCAEAA